MREDEFDVYVKIVNHQEHFYRILNEHYLTALTLSKLPKNIRIYTTSQYPERKINAATGWITTFGRRSEREEIDPTKLYTIITNHNII